MRLLGPFHLNGQVDVDVEVRGCLVHVWGFVPASSHVCGIVVLHTVKKHKASPQRLLVTSDIHQSTSEGKNVSVS